MQTSIQHQHKVSPMKQIASTPQASSVLKGLIALLLLLPSVAVPLYGQKPDRSEPPELGPPLVLRLPPIERFALSNGVQILLMEKHEVPLVQVNVLVKTGSAMDPPGESGLASMTAAMLDEGAGSRDALQLAEAIDYLGASISSSAGQHATLIALHTPLSKLDSAVPLLADIVLRPSFPEKELDRLRKERLTTLLQWRDEPRAIASVLFDRVLFGTQHPYGLPSIGSEKTLRAMKVRDLKRFHKTYFRPNNATLIVVGDVTKTSVLPMLESAFGDWKRGAAASVNWPEVAQVEDRTVYLVDKPGAAQSEIRIGRIGVSRFTEDYFPILVMNTTLGGSFTSRLNQNLREQHGYTYGARSVFVMRALPGPFLATAAVQTEVTDKALREFMKELKGILRPISDEELTRAKNYLALGYPDNFQSVAQIARQLSEIVVYNLPDDYFNSYIQNVLAVSKGDVTRVAREYLDPAKVTIVVVGDRKKIEKSVHDLKLGSLVEMTIEDVLGKAPKL
ncbi:MAG: M16 family metallopeptidase [Bacteroidota bacterium]